MIRDLLAWHSLTILRPVSTAVELQDPADRGSPPPPPSNPSKGCQGRGARPHLAVFFAEGSSHGAAVPDTP